MKFVKSMIDGVGNTPLIYLKKASEMTGCTILGKAEFTNLGGSVKDRAAKAMLQDAFQTGKLAKDGIVVEGTAGNTGIGLALIGNQLGLKTHIVMNNNQTIEKKQALIQAGAILHQVEPKPYKDEGNYIHQARRLAEKLAKDNPAGGTLWTNQFDNLANRRAHIETTAQEIWRDTEGKIDGFICAVGTGGTLSGVAEGLRAKNPNIKIGLADPGGANLYGYYTKGVLEGEGDSISEGIGQGRITGNLEGLSVDMPYRIHDKDALPWIFDLIKYEGIAVGISSGINIAGAVLMANALGKGKVIVTVLCDGAARYHDKLFNKEFLQERDLPFPEWL